ncbi:unnamed protein product, partial [Mesorhabditis belari]|uniref:phosphorylase kinase n=1 Tax=Mesorhabditis belari TaxID=2138241 RepID=A0AAF3E957_9BILA
MTADDERENSPGGYGTPEDDQGFYASYESKEILGSGLASTVRRCIEKGSGASFAVKIVDVSTEKQSDKDARRLYEETISEVKILRQLAGHPSIIAIHDFFETPSFLFTVFEMAPKGELFDQLNATVTLTEKKAKRLMKQLFEGVKYMHENRIVHRDLKLENILCIDDERIVISDFGFAMILPDEKLLKDLCGTPGYLAPETLRCQMYEDAKGYGLEVDQWALGVILYTFLAGYAPFYHRRQLMMMRLIQEGRFEFRREQWDSITSECKELVSLLLTVDVAKRITAAEALRHPWMAGVGEAVVIEQRKTRKSDKRRLFRHAIIWVRFFIRLSNYRKFSQVIDRDAVKKRPFRDREIRHEAESAMFCVYGHWVNRGFHYSRDMLFANAPRPKHKREATVQSG